MIDQKITLQASEKLTIKELKGINYLIKSFQIHVARNALSTIDPSRLVSNGLRLYYHHLQAKVSLFEFETSRDTVFLEQAREQMQLLLDISRFSRCKLRDPNCLYTRCLIALNYSEYATNPKLRKQALTEAELLTRTGLKNFPELQCFNWLGHRFQINS